MASGIVDLSGVVRCVSQPFSTGESNAGVGLQLNGDAGEPVAASVCASPCSVFR